MSIYLTGFRQLSRKTFIPPIPENHAENEFNLWIVLSLTAYAQTDTNFRIAIIYYCFALFLIAPVKLKGGRKHVHFIQRTAGHPKSG
jgi:hypothetical protein